MGAVAWDVRRVAESLASAAQIPDSLQDISGNCAAIVTCVGELQATTSRLVTEVKSLTVAVKANSAAIAAEAEEAPPTANHHPPAADAGRDPMRCSPALP